MAITYHTIDTVIIQKHSCLSNVVTSVIHAFRLYQQMMRKPMARHVISQPVSVDGYAKMPNFLK